MPERSVPAEVKVRHYDCDDCSSQVIYTGFKATGCIKPWYEHRCRGCGKTYDLDVMYPRWEFK